MTALEQHWDHLYYEAGIRSSDSPEEAYLKALRFYVDTLERLEQTWRTGKDETRSRLACDPNEFASYARAFAELAADHFGVSPGTA